HGVCFHVDLEAAHPVVTEQLDHGINGHGALWLLVHLRSAPSINSCQSTTLCALTPQPQFARSRISSISSDGSRIARMAARAISSYIELESRSAESRKASATRSIISFTQPSPLVAEAASVLAAPASAGPAP